MKENLSVFARGIANFESHKVNVVCVGQRSNEVFWREDKQKKIKFMKSVAKLTQSPFHNEKPIECAHPQCNKYFGYQLVEWRSSAFVFELKRAAQKQKWRWLSVFFFFLSVSLRQTLTPTLCGLNESFHVAHSDVLRALSEQLSFAKRLAHSRALSWSTSKFASKSCEFWHL